ncbi:MAG: Bifunctional ribulose 5-phosphate reductase/CDP-ribitol pyrophosphorylase Bcs1 [Chlamydiia bacterium]|nr:Bifunctional ribulose 5-phosphate reductase/CDP-ribitol pyrophosphorylase Bcs1 [Chlamydiia bacterium]
MKKSKDNFTSCLLLAAGTGSRFGDDLPKQFHYLSGKKIYLHTLEQFLEIPSIHEIVIVCSYSFVDEIKKDILNYPDENIRIAIGGESRQQSSYLGLLACDLRTTHVMIHDSVRPFISRDIILENIDLAMKYGASDTCISSHDTIVHTKDEKEISNIPNRKQYLRGQTPQTFSYPLILKAHQNAYKKGIENATDDCQLVLMEEHPVKIAEGSEENIKITTELDLYYAEQILRLKMTLPKAVFDEDTLSGKVFAITGGTGGIGSKISSMLKEKGAKVLELSRNSQYKVDLTDEVITQDVFEKIYKEYGELDGLINSIGYLKVQNLDILSSPDIKRLIDCNFTSFVYACKYCRIKDHGHILNLSSSSYIRGRKSYAIYSGMKAAIVNFTQGLALEKPSLHINSIIPKRTDTCMRRENFPNEEKTSLLSAEKVAESIIHTLLAKNLTGMTIEIKK